MGRGMLALKSHHYQEGSASKLYLKRIYITLSPVHNTNEAQKKSSFYLFFFFLFSLSWGLQIKVLCCPWYKRRQILHCRWFCLKKEKRKKEKYYTEFEICVKAINLVHHLETFFVVICKETFQSLITWDITSSDQSQGAKSGTPIYNIFMHVFIMDEHHAFTSSPRN